MAIENPENAQPEEESQEELLESEASGEQKTSRAKAADGAGRSLWETGDENQKFLNIAYIASILLVIFVGGHAVQAVMNWVFGRFFQDSSIALQIERLPVSPGFIISAAFAIGLGVWARRSSQVNGFGLDVVAELKKVTWPPLDITWKSTLAVIVTVIFFSIILGFFDFFWGSLLRLLIS